MLVLSSARGSVGDGDLTGRIIVNFILNDFMNVVTCFLNIVCDFLGIGLPSLSNSYELLCSRYFHVRHSSDKIFFKYSCRVPSRVDVSKYQEEGVEDDFSDFQYFDAESLNSNFEKTSHMISTIKETSRNLPENKFGNRSGLYS